jgi:hypothetical protein
MSPYFRVERVMIERGIALLHEPSLPANIFNERAPELFTVRRSSIGLLKQRLSIALNDTRLERF